MTSLLAGLATGPFAAFHFGRLATFGLLGNLLAVPVVTLAVMPALVTAMFLMPLGLDGPVLFLVGQGLRVVLWIAQWTADLPGAVRHVPQMAPAGLLLATLGLLTLTVLKAPWRLAGALLLVLAVPVSGRMMQPDVFLSRDLRNVGLVRTGEAPLSVLSQRRDRFSVESWLQALGQPQDVKQTSRLDGCGQEACRVAANRIAILPDRTSLAQACAEVEVVILQARAVPADYATCRAFLVTLDANGHHPPASLTKAKQGWVIKTAKGFSTAP